MYPHSDFTLWYMAQAISQDRLREAKQYRLMREACKGKVGYFHRVRDGILLGMARILMGYGRRSDFPWSGLSKMCYDIVGWDKSRYDYPN